MRRNMFLAVSFLAGLVASTGCVVNEGEKIDLTGQDVLLTLLHTSDTHSRLFPYELEVGEVDRQLGLVQDNGPFGGGARLAYLVKRERGRSGRSLWIDTGDPFQGAPIFNFFEGEAEFRVLSEIGLDVMVIGNHEFDRGGPNLAKQLDAWARFPALAANYRFEPSEYSENDLARLTKPYALFNVQGLRVAVIGIGDTGSMFSIFETGNRLGVTPLNVVDTVQQWVDFLRPSADVIVLATHQGLSGDEYTIRHTEGVDVVLGGHLHIVLDPPKVIPDCQDTSLQHARGCTPRPVLLCHSGGFMKYLGRLDLVLREPLDAAERARNGFEVASHQYTLYPVDSTVPEDPAVAYLLEPYAIEMEQRIDLDRLIGYAPTTVRRFGSTGGDSPLGNLVADSMWLRRGIETDFALTNTTGIRTDINPGPVTTEALFNVFPFDNTITTMFLSGLEVQDLFDYVARRTASRGCASQAQIAGARVVLNCRGCDRTGGLPCAESVIMGDGPAARAIDPLGSYELATSNYLAQGGSGYVVLRRNTTQQDSGIAMREALIDRIRGGAPCGSCSSDAECAGGQRCLCRKILAEDGVSWVCAKPGICSCDADADCGENRACFLPGRWRWNDTTMTCEAGGTATGSGRCVLSTCFTDVADLYMRRSLDVGDDPAQVACGFYDLAGTECAEVACVDAGVGALEDGRIRAYLP